MSMIPDAGPMHPIPAARRDARPRADGENTLTAETLEQLVAHITRGVGHDSSAGVNVSQRKAMANAAHWTSCLVLAETIAQLPVEVYKPTDDGRGEEIATDAPLRKLIGKRGRPNEWQTSFDFRFGMVWQYLNFGDFFAFKNRIGTDRRIAALIPLEPGQVEVEQGDDFSLVYRVTGRKGGSRRFTRDAIFHVMGPSENGYRGIDPLTFMREVVGLAIAQDTSAAKLFANGARLAGVLEMEKGFQNPEREKEFMARWKEVYGGLENAWGTPVLEGGMKFREISQKNDEAQLVESRQLSRSLVASLRRVPAHMVGDLSNATFSNIENLARQFVDFAAAPHMERCEQSFDQQLLTEAEREAGYKTKINARALLRGDHKTRAAFYKAGLTDGWLSPNEVRGFEDLNPFDGGDEYRRPLNTEPVGGTSDGEADDDDPDDDQLGGDPADGRRPAGRNLRAVD